MKKYRGVFWIATLIFLEIANIPMWFREHNNKKDPPPYFLQQKHTSKKTHSLSPSAATVSSKENHKIHPTFWNAKFLY